MSKKNQDLITFCIFPKKSNMTLIKSISGIRGTIGGEPGNNLTPLDIVSFTSAYASFIAAGAPSGIKTKIVVGRDARTSGSMLSGLVCNTIIALGIDVVDLGLSTTPSVEMAVTALKAQGGIVLTASHNPAQWNALKLLNAKGEFISDAEGKKIIQWAQEASFHFATVDQIGRIEKFEGGFIDEHIQTILQLPYVDSVAIGQAGISVVVDAVNSTGGIAIPKLLRALGVNIIHEINCEPNGIFSHNPEPLPENLTEISETVKNKKADMGIVVDPDVDRLAFVCEDGSMFGEEYTLVAVADYMLSVKGGNTVSNLSSSRALAVVTKKHGYAYNPAAVGEVNVVTKMKETQAVIGGEGNGGIIVPDLHYGRDALVGLAIFLTHYAKKSKRMTAIRHELPQYFMSKNKIELNEQINVDELLVKIEQAYQGALINTMDGVKIDLEEGWIHLRKSNTEPIIRIYTEASTQAGAEALADELKEKVHHIIG
jgi:phosphomannomutase